MEIKQRISLYFWQDKEGIVIDNAYDEYLRNRYIEYVKQNKIKYLWFQDVDMDLLSFFPDIEFISVPKEAINVKNLEQLKGLKGMDICSNVLDQISLQNFPLLKYLIVHGQPNKLDNITKCYNLEHLSCNQWKFHDLTWIDNLQNLCELRLDFCRNLESLQGLERLSNLQSLDIEYCSRFKNIDNLKEISMLEKLIITDCMNIENFDALRCLYNLKILYISTFQIHKRGTLPSLQFIEELPQLESFMTDYYIQSKDLKPLLRLKDVDILRFYPGYNVTEKELKH